MVRRLAAWRRERCCCSQPLPSPHRGRCRGFVDDVVGVGLYRRRVLRLSGKDDVRVREEDAAHHLKKGAVGLRHISLGRIGLGRIGLGCARFGRGRRGAGRGSLPARDPDPKQTRHRGKDEHYGSNIGALAWNTSLWKGRYPATFPGTSKICVKLFKRLEVAEASLGEKKAGASSPAPICRPTPHGRLDPRARGGLRYFGKHIARRSEPAKLNEANGTNGRRASTSSSAPSMKT